jgi:hypothetical protein
MIVLNIKDSPWRKSYNRDKYLTDNARKICMKDFVSGKLVSGGGMCEGCGKRLEEGEKVFTPADEIEETKEYLYCQGCRPDEDDLPSGVLGLEPALAVEEPGSDERLMGIEVKAGSSCSNCDHCFEEDEWLFVGVVEGLNSGNVFCSECYQIECEAEE